MTARSRVLALISTLTFGGESFRDGGSERLELLAGIAVHFEVSTEGVTHFVATATNVLAKDEHVSLAAQLIDARPMVASHRQNQIGLLDELPREQAGAMTGQIEPTLEADEIGAFGGRRAVPGSRSRRRHFHVDPALLERALEERRGEWAAADVAGADKQDVLGHGARRPTARRSSLTLSVPSRTICARGRVQSTTVDGGRFPRTPPSSTSSVPDSTAGAKSRAMASAPGPGGWPGRLADVEVSGAPRAATRPAIA